MKDNWLKDIHDSMTGYEAPEPAGLWDAIERRRRKAAPVMWPRIATAAMLAAAIVLGIYMLVRRDGPDMHTPPSTEMKLTATATPVREAAKSATGANTVRKVPITHRSAETATESTQIAPEAIAGTIPDSTAAEPVPEPETPSERTPGREPLPGTTRHITPDGFRTESRGRLAFGLHTSGSAGSNFASRMQPQSDPGNTNAGSADWNGEPMLGILLFNKGLPTERSVRHSLPVHAGFSVAYSLTDRLAIETGLQYSYLRSDISEGSESHYVDAVQTLQYIGVPVNVKYSIAFWKRFEVYASAGVTGEKCVSAKLRRKYVLNDKPSGESTGNLDEKPLQWSANASAGLQCRVSDRLGIYVEPGISYYFDDKSELETIYKDKPWNFSLDFGVRLTVGR